MATTTTTHVIDDIDATTEDVRTVTFSVDGAHYEIDLSAENQAKLTEALAVFVGHARKTPSPTTGKRGKTARHRRSTANGASEGPAARDVRAWAQENGHPVPDRGRVPAAVFSAYTEAH